MGGREGCSVGWPGVSLISGISQSGYGCDNARRINAPYAMVKAIGDIGGAKGIHNHGGREGQMRVARQVAVSRKARVFTARKRC